MICSNWQNRIDKSEFDFFNFAMIPKFSQTKLNDVNARIRNLYQNHVKRKKSNA